MLKFILYHNWLSSAIIIFQLTRYSFSIYQNVLILPTYFCCYLLWIILREVWVSVYVVSHCWLHVYVKMFPTLAVFTTSLNCVAMPCHVHCHRTISIYALRCFAYISLSYNERYEQNTRCVWSPHLMKEENAKRPHSHLTIEWKIVFWMNLPNHSVKSHNHYLIY